MRLNRLRCLSRSAVDIGRSIVRLRRDVCIAVQRRRARRARRRTHQRRSRAGSSWRCCCRRRRRRCVISILNDCVFFFWSQRRELASQFGVFLRTTPANNTMRDLVRSFTKFCDLNVDHCVCVSMCVDVCSIFARSVCDWHSACKRRRSRCAHSLPSRSTRRSRLSAHMLAARAPTNWRKSKRLNGRRVVLRKRTL